MGLLKEERVLNACWVGDPFSNGVADVCISATARSLNRGAIDITYDYGGWDAYLDAKKRKAATVF